MTDPLERTTWTPKFAGRRREYVDLDARAWRVYELVASPYDRRHGARISVLVFECAELVRRVRTYPADWYELSDADLQALAESL